MASHSDSLAMIVANPMAALQLQGRMLPFGAPNSETSSRIVAMRGVQSGRLTLSIDGEQEQLDEGAVAGMPDAAANVAGLYTLLRNDILNGTSTAPDFEHAAQLTRLVDAVFASSRQGVRQGASGWPQN
jgi:hypothetical protein